MEILSKLYFLKQDVLELVKTKSLFAVNQAGIAQKLPGRIKTHRRSGLSQMSVLNQERTYLSGYY